MGKAMNLIVAVLATTSLVLGGGLGWSAYARERDRREALEQRVGVLEVETARVSIDGSNLDRATMTADSRLDRLERCTGTGQGPLRTSPPPNFIGSDC